MKQNNTDSESKDALFAGRFLAPLKNVKINTPFDETLEFLKHHQTAQAKQRPERITLLALNYVWVHRFQFVVTGLIVALGFVACTTPFELEETSGYILSGKFFPNENSSTITDQISQLPWSPTKIQYGMTGVERRFDGSNSAPEWLTVAMEMPDISKHVAVERLHDFERIPGIISPEIHPISVSVKQSLLQAYGPSIIRPKVWEVNIDLGPWEHFVQYEDEIKAHSDRLKEIGIEAKIFANFAGDRGLALRSDNWNSINNDALKVLTRLKTELEEFFDRRIELGYTIQGQFPRHIQDVVTDRLIDLGWTKVVQIGFIEDIDEFTTFEVRLPGISQNLAIERMREVSNLSDVSSVKLRPLAGKK